MLKSCRGISGLRCVIRRSCTVVAIAALLVGVAFAEDKAKDRAYAEMVDKLNAGDFSVNFRDVRFACIEASTCDARGESKDLIAMRRAFQASKFDETVKLGQKLIADGFPNIEAHMSCARAYEALKNNTKAEFHHTIASGLLRSILNTGDGKSKETAFEVIGTFEEYIVLMVMGLPPFGEQSVMPGKPHSYDVIKVKDPKSGADVSVYFKIDAFFPMKGL